MAVLFLTAGTAWAQKKAVPAPATRVAALERLAAELEARAVARRTPLYHRLKARTSGPQGVLNATPGLELRGIVNGRPRFYETVNLFAAQTVGTDHLQPGGITGLNLTGANLAGELGMWDFGLAFEAHQEFGGRVQQQDDATTPYYHGTHVAGTLVAAGVNPLAKGMSPAATLHTFDWTLDEAEMATAAAAGMLVSNHSYANPVGWSYRGGDVPWYWYGDPAVSELEDPGFGLYDEESQAWDQIAYDAPHYLIVKAAGNDRDDAGPGPGGEHLVWNPDTFQWVVSTTTRDPDGGAFGYDTIPYKGAAKNILTVGAVWDIMGGWSQPADVVNSLFGGWGPTDDGRIKPDLVANGMGLMSCTIGAVDAYVGDSGTSMASPNAAGTLHLLAQYWKDTHGGAPPRSATLKGIAIHTANEAGAADGPDYEFGWGLLNAVGAAYLINGDTAFADRAVETDLAQGEADTLTWWSSGNAPVTATICWTDPAAVPSAWSLDPPEAKLVNDLDLRVERVADGFVHRPWILDPANPSAAATTGDNFRDNVEKITVGAPSPGAYRLIVTHKGSLDGGPQAYSLLTSGLGPQPSTPVVSNVAFAQRTDGSGVVDVTYDVADPDSPFLTVALEASSDGGVTWDLAVASVSGDVGFGVVPGPGKTIVWNFNQDHVGAFIPAAVLRVTATD
jgi:hypothetical protein